MPGIFDNVENFIVLLSTDTYEIPSNEELKSNPSPVMSESLRQQVNTLCYIVGWFIHRTDTHGDLFRFDI